MNLFIARFKKAWLSLTIWVNGIAATIWLFLPELQMTFPQLQAYVPDNIYKYGMAILIIANIVLRFKTTQDLIEKGNHENPTL